MRRATQHFYADDWPLAEAGDSVTLDYDARHRRRIVLTTDKGETVLLDLERAVAMGEGDGLALEGGGWIKVVAAPEPVVEISCATPGELVRIAWHLGNRHLPTQVTPAALYIRPDSVIETMLVDLHARCTRLERPFQPERGAYGQNRNSPKGGAPQHAHGHHHAHSHPHSHE